MEVLVRTKANAAVDRGSTRSDAGRLSGAARRPCGATKIAQNFSRSGSRSSSRHHAPRPAAPAFFGPAAGRSTRMNPPLPALGSRYLRKPDAALHLGLSPRTLQKHRCSGTGPARRQPGGRVVYGIEAHDAWAEMGRKRKSVG